MLYQKVKTPCIGICSTVFGDNVCRGCKRFVHEVIDWNHYSELQKQLVWQRLEHLLQQVVEQYLLINDAQLLEVKIVELGISHPAELNTHCKAFYFLKATHAQLDSETCAEQFGFSILPSQGHHTASDVFSKLANQYLELSKAYYDATVARTFSVEPSQNQQVKNQQASNAKINFDTEENTMARPTQACFQQTAEIERES